MLGIFEKGLKYAVLLLISQGRILNGVKQTKERNTDTEVGARQSRRCGRKQLLGFTEMNAEMSSGAVTLSSALPSERQIKGLLTLSLVKLILLFP